MKQDQIGMSAGKLETIVSQSGLSAQSRRTLQGFNVYLADGFKNDNPDEFPMGYYRTLWAIGHGERFDGAMLIEFDAFHDSDVSHQPSIKKGLRLNAAMQAASQWISDNKEAGRYD